MTESLLRRTLSSSWKRTEERLDAMNPQQQIELMLAGWKTYSEMYVNEN